MAEWSRISNTFFAFPSGKLWSNVDDVYKRTIVTPKIVKLTMCQADPDNAEAMISQTSPPILSNRPIP